MLTHRRLRRTVGAMLVVAGAVLMWLVPQTAFESSSGAGLILLVTGVVLELAGIAVEHRRRARR